MTVYQQKVQGKSLNGFKGILVVLAVLAAALLGSAFFTLLGKRIGNVSSIAFIAYCCLIAWYLLNHYIMGFVYAVGGGCLRVCRTYGKRERFMCDVWLNMVQGYGSPEDVAKRFPDARIEKAVKERCDIEHFAIAYKTDGRVAVLYIQPDEKLKAMIVEEIKKK